MHWSGASRARGREIPRRKDFRRFCAALVLAAPLSLAVAADSAVAGSFDRLPLPGLQSSHGKPPSQGRKVNPARRARLDLLLERTPVIVKTDYERLPPMGKHGAVGGNRVDGARFFLPHQQLGDLYVRAGIVHGSRRLVGRGLEAFDYGFRRQRRGGGSRLQTEEYAFFVESVAHSLLLLERTRYGRNHRRKLSRYRRPLRRLARRMTAPTAWAAFKRRNASYTHSAYTVGTALALTDAVTGSKAYARPARTAIKLGLKRQRRNGVNPELGGYDVRYQMAGLVYAERWAVYSPGGALARRVRRMVGRGLAWMSNRVDEDGWIDWRGSTRTCRERNRYGERKTPGYGYAIRAFAYWGALTRNKEQSAKARRARSYLERRDGRRSLCGSKGPLAPRDRDDDRGGGGGSPIAPLDRILRNDRVE